MFELKIKTPETTTVEAKDLAKAIAQNAAYVSAMVAAGCSNGVLVDDNGNSICEWRYE